MSDNTKFIWTDGTSDEINAATIDDNFAAKYSRQKNDLKELIIGSRVKSIELNAFKMCKNLEKVEMSPSVEKLGAFAFASCEKLQEIILPENVDTISSSAFSYCSRLKKIKIPDKITLIDDEAFSYCTDLTEVILPKNLNCIYVSAFRNCQSLTHVKIPASTEIIESMSFENCKNLETVEFEDNAQLKTIGLSAFADCPNLKLINQTAITKLKTIGDQAFDGCKSLTDFTLIEGMTYIGTRAFRDCSSLCGEIKFPATLKRFSTEIFTNCISLESVSFVPKEKYTIGAGLFAGCEKLKKVTGLNNAVEIQTCAFMGCSSLEEITLGAALTSIGDWAFKGCISLKLNVPESVSKIGTDAFAYIDQFTYKGQAEGYPWGASISEPLDIHTEQYFDITGRTVKNDEQLKLVAFDLVWYLQYLHKHGLFDNKLFEEYEDNILKYTRGENNEYLLVNMLSNFDNSYGTDEFPLNADIENFRDRLYIFSKELE